MLYEHSDDIKNLNFTPDTVTDALCTFGICLPTISLTNLGSWKHGFNFKTCTETRLFYFIAIRHSIDVTINRSGLGAGVAIELDAWQTKLKSETRLAANTEEGLVFREYIYKDDQLLIEVSTEDFSAYAWETVDSTIDRINETHYGRIILAKAGEVQKRAFEIWDKASMELQQSETIQVLKENTQQLYDTSKAKAEVYGKAAFQATKEHTLKAYEVASRHGKDKFKVIKENVQRMYENRGEYSEAAIEITTELAQNARQKAGEVFENTRENAGKAYNVASEYGKATWETVKESETGKMVVDKAAEVMKDMGVEDGVGRVWEWGAQGWGAAYERYSQWTKE